jgi:hypothetical protein
MDEGCVLAIRLLPISGEYIFIGTYSWLSGTACSAAAKPILEWVPSQKGFLVDAPQRHKDTFLPGVTLCSFPS